MAHFCEATSGAVWLADLTPLTAVGEGVQKIRYFQSKEFGRVLVINDELQHVEAWAPFYHEIIVHLPCSFLEKPRTALIMGGGSLFAAEELLKYPSITHVDLVDHDPNVITATLDVYPERRSAIEDPRLRLIYERWEMFIKRSGGKYDLIINDCCDLSSEDALADEDLYRLLYERLSSDGLVSDLIYRSLYSGFSRSSFERIRPYEQRAASLLAIPEYPGVLHLLTMWGRNRNVSQRQRKALNRFQNKMKKEGLFQIYNPSFMNFYLYLPPYLRSFL